MGKKNPWLKINTTKRLWLLYTHGFRDHQSWVPAVQRCNPVVPSTNSLYALVGRSALRGVLHCRYAPSRNWMQMRYEKTNGSHKMGDLLVAYPEDRLHKSFMMRYPQFKQEPIDLNSFNPPIARRYAWQQLQLMQQGMSKEKARLKLDEKLEEWNLNRSVEASAGGSVIATIQAEEEAALQDALIASRKGQRPEFAAKPTVNIYGLDIRL